MSKRNRIHRVLRGRRGLPPLLQRRKRKRRILDHKKKRRRIRPEIPFPMEFVMDEILTRLPAKSLMRFKCVSKLWSSHISSLYFRNRFLTVPSQPRPRLYMCLVDPRDSHKNVTLSLAPDTNNSYVVDPDTIIPRRGAYIVQNLGGFMCYTSWQKPRIYNPTTRKLVTLPAAIKSSKIIPPGEGRKFISYYYGHDPINDQYKVICSTGKYMKLLQEMRSEHWVYVLKPRRGSWKKLAPTPPPPPHLPYKGGVCIDGVIYYMGYPSLQNCALVSFDIRSREFKMIPIPHMEGVDVRERFSDMCLIKYGGKVAIFDQTDRNKGLLDLWTVEDIANNKWLRKTMVLKPSQRHLVNNTKFSLAGTSQNGKVFLMPRGWFIPFHFLCYDIQSNDLRNIEIKGVPEYWSGKEEKSKIEIMLVDGSESLNKVIDVDGSE